MTTGLAEGIKESLVTNEILQVELAKIRTDPCAHLKTELIFWVVGTVGLGTNPYSLLEISPALATPVRQSLALNEISGLSFPH